MSTPVRARSTNRRPRSSRDPARSAGSGGSAGSSLRAAGERARQVDSRPPGRRWPWVLAVVLLLALAAGGTYVVRSTALFSVTQVAVVGAGERLSTQVQQALAGEVGTPLIRVDTAGVRATVADLPDVAAVTVGRSWPHTLTVSVTPRVPVAVTNANGAWWLMDADGLPYRTTPDKPPKLTSVELAAPGPGDPATMAALCVVQALPATMPTAVQAVRAESPYRVVLRLVDQRSVIWGDCSNSPRKAAVLPVMLAQPGTVFDLSDPSMVSVK